MNPLDEYLQMKKEAIWRDVGHKVLMGGALAAGGALIGAGASVIDKIRDSISHKRDFQEMMSIDPELKNIQAERPAFFNQAYNSLRRINPAFGTDPIIAGSYMRKMMANPDAAGLTLATTVKPPSIDEKGMAWGGSVGEKGLGLDFKF